jgi:HrpA-like helicases
MIDNFTSSIIHYPLSIIHSQMSYQSLNITYPDLPVVEHREEFFEMLEKHQVVIVKADTGSGKSTAAPQIPFGVVFLKGRSPCSYLRARSATS